jgi:hypothetical protein
MASRRVAKKTGATSTAKGRDIVSPNSGKAKAGGKPEVLPFNQSTINAINKAGPKGHELAHILPREGRLLEEAFNSEGATDPKTKIKSYAPGKTGYEKGVVESGLKLPKGENRGRLDSDHQVAVLTDPEVEALNTMRWRDKDRGFTSGFGPEITALAKQNDKPFDFVEYQGEKIPTLNDSDGGGYGGGPQGSGSTGGSVGGGGGGGESSMEKYVREYYERIAREKREAEAAAKATIAAAEKKERERLAGIEQERIAREKRESEARARAVIAAAEKKERERLAGIERERVAREKREKDARDKTAREKKEKEEAQQAAADQAAADKAIADKAIADQAAADKAIADQAITDAQQAADDLAEEEATAEEQAIMDEYGGGDEGQDPGDSDEDYEPEEEVQDRGDHGSYDPDTNTVTYDTTGQEGENYIADIDEDFSGDDWSDIPEGTASEDTVVYDTSSGYEGEFDGLDPDDVTQQDNDDTFDGIYDDYYEGEGFWGLEDDPYEDPEYWQGTIAPDNNDDEGEVNNEFEGLDSDPQQGTYDDYGGGDEDFEPSDSDEDYEPYEPEDEYGDGGEFGDGTFDPDTGLGDGEEEDTPENEYGEDGEFGDGTFDPDIGLGDGDTGNDDPIVPEDNGPDDIPLGETFDDTATGSLSDADRQSLMDALDKQYGEYAGTDYEALYRNEFTDDLKEDHTAAEKGLDYNFLTSGDRTEFNTKGNTVNDQNDYLGNLLAGEQNDYLNTMSSNFGTGAKNDMNDWYYKNRKGINDLQVAADGTYDFDFTDLDLSDYADPSASYDPEFFGATDDAGDKLYYKKYQDPDKTYYGGIEGGTDPATTTPNWEDDDDDPRTNYIASIKEPKPGTPGGDEMIMPSSAAPKKKKKKPVPIYNS